MDSRKIFVSLAFGVALLVFASFFVLGNEINSVKVDPDVPKAFQSDEKVEVIIGLQEKDGSKPGTDNVKSKVLSKLEDYAITAQTANDWIIAEISYEDYNRLLNDRSLKGDVYGIELRRYLEPALIDTVDITGASDVWEIEIDGVPLDGAGQTACVVDSGINFTHPGLVGTNALPDGGSIFCFSNECIDGSDIMPSSDHGSFIAGIIAANGYMAPNGYNITGVARGAKLIDVKVPTISDTLAKGIEWCVEHADEYNISVIVTAQGIVGGPNPYEGNCDNFFPVTLPNVINDALAENIVVTAAAGNQGNNTYIQSPACVSGAVPVGATDKNNTFASFSNYDSNLVKLFAPGKSIYSTSPSATGGYGVGSGTSFSSPHVGAVALILNQLRELTGYESRSLHPKDDIENLLHQTGMEVINLPGEGNPSIINIYNAVMVLEEVSPEVVLNTPNDGEVYQLSALVPTIARSSQIGSATFDFKCSASDWAGVQDVELQIRKTETGNLAYSSTANANGEENFEANFSVMISGNSRNLISELFETPSSVWSQGEYSWNCLGKDVNGNEGFASEDRVFVID